MKRFYFCIVLLLGPFTQAGERTTTVQILKPCQSGEEVRVNARSDSQDFKQLARLVPHFSKLKAPQPAEGSQALQLLSESLDLKKKPGISPLLQSAANYGLARSLGELGLIHASHQLHEKIILGGSAEFARASAFCTQEQLAIYPTLALQNPKEVHQRVTDWIMNAPATDSTALNDALGALALQAALLGFKDKAPTTGWFSLKNPWSNLARGLLAAKQNELEPAISALTEFKSNPGAAPREWIDITHLTLGRALSEAGRHAEAEASFHQVSKSSNLLPEALLGLSWQRLNRGKKREAVGAALSLQAGHMARVFAPESLLVLSMALNELCDYPRGHAALQLLAQSYGDTALWLNALLTDSSKSLTFPFEAKALQALLAKGKNSLSDVPRNVETQWLASPVFQESLREKKLILKERAAIDEFPALAQKEQARLAREIETAAQKLDLKIQARKKSKTTQNPEEKTAWKEQLLAFRELIRKEKRYRQSAPFGLAVTKKQKQDLERRNTVLSQRIRQDLLERTRAMKENLQWVAEQAALVEIEVQQGGSRDLILTHARGVKSKNEPARDPSRAREESWDWGRRNAASLRDGEIWEDELGSFEADLSSRCPKHAQAD
jgi:hypothetical protein